MPLNVAQLEEGSYRQDEFYPLAAQFRSQVATVTLTPTTTDCNFTELHILPPGASTPIMFRASGSRIMAPEEPIVATGPVTLRRLQAARLKNNSSYTLSSYDYPAIGYNVDYAMPTVIRASDNAPCYAEVPAPVKDFAVESLSADVIVPGAIAGGETTMVPKWVTVMIGDAEYTLLSGVAPAEE